MREVSALERVRVWAKGQDLLAQYSCCGDHADDAEEEMEDEDQPKKRKSANGKAKVS